MVSKRAGFSEKDLCTEIIRSFEAIGAFAFKVPDAPGYWRGDAEAPTRFTPTRAFDIIAIVQGRGYAIEAKIKRNGGAVKPEEIRDEQRECLSRVHAAGGGAYLAVGYRFKCGPAQRKTFGSVFARELYLVRWDRWQALEAAHPEGVQRAALVAERGSAVQWIGGGLWNLDPSKSDEQTGAESAKGGVQDGE